MSRFAWSSPAFFAFAAEEAIEIPRNHPRSVGAILGRPGVKARIIYAKATGTGYGLRETASEYFNAPACHTER
jgi:hypothetical protein